MDIKTKICTLLAMVMLLSCHKDKTPEKGLPVLREGIYGLYCDENSPEHFERYFYVKYNKFYLTKSEGISVPACLNRSVGRIVFKNDSISHPFEITEGNETFDSCYYYNDSYGANYAIYYLSEGKADYLDWKIQSVSGTFNIDYPSNNYNGKYRLVFLRSYPQ